MEAVDDVGALFGKIGFFLGVCFEIEELPLIESGIAFIVY